MGMLSPTFSHCKLQQAPGSITKHFCFPGVLKIQSLCDPCVGLCRVPHIPWSLLQPTVTESESTHPSFPLAM